MAVLRAFRPTPLAQRSGTPTTAPHDRPPVRGLFGDARAGRRSTGRLRGPQADDPVGQPRVQRSHPLGGRPGVLAVPAPVQGRGKSSWRVEGRQGRGLSRYGVERLEERGRPGQGLRGGQRHPDRPGRRPLGGRQGRPRDGRGAAAGRPQARADRPRRQRRAQGLPAAGGHHRPELHRRFPLQRPQGLPDGCRPARTGRPRPRHRGPAAGARRALVDDRAASAHRPGPGAAGRQGQAAVHSRRSAGSLAGRQDLLLPSLHRPALQHRDPVSRRRLR